MFKKFILVVLYSLAFCVYAENFTVGEDYTELSNPVVASKGQATVVEFFSFGCPACFHLEKVLSEWAEKRKNTVVFSRVPVVFHSEWEIYAKAYYIAQAFELLPGATDKLFQAIQVEQVTLQTNSEMVQFFIKSFSANPALTESAFEHALGVDLKIKAGMVEAGQAEVNKIPAFVVNGRYKTDLSMAKDPARLIAILDMLVKK